jgi:hypothetical protein
VIRSAIVLICSRTDVGYAARHSLMAVAGTGGRVLLAGVD